MIEQLQELKDIYTSAKLQLERNKEPLEDLLKMNGFLKAIADEPSLILEKVDAVYRKFFFEELTVGALKKLAMERSRDEKYLEVISNIMENYLRLFTAMLKSGQYNPVFFDSMKHVFKYDSTLNLYSYQISEEELKRLRSSNQEWRKELKEGDMVDAIIDDVGARCSGWSQARIDQVNGDTLHLEFIYDVKTTDRYIDRWSIEIAQFETKTKELFEWKHTVEIDMKVDSHDKTVWNKATVLDIKDQTIGPNRTAKMAMIGFRVYMENGPKSDEKGQFDGWSNRFDEWISIYSPRIQPYLTKTLRGGSSDDNDLDDNYDYLVKPQEGHTRVYVVPRLRKCTSSLFIRLMNNFGNEGGFDLLLDCLAREDNVTSSEDTSQQPKALDLNLLGILVEMFSYPYTIYHKDFITEYGPKFATLCISRLRNAPEKSLRDVRKERIDGIIKSIDNFQRRLLTKDERERIDQVLKLEIALMCLKSSFMERRIQGIRELNQIIKSNRMYSYKSFSAASLIEWMDANGVLMILFDPKKTHLQLVQRCNDILRLLLQEDKLTLDLLDDFWSLTKSDYKFEVYKIINEVSLWLSQDHIDFIFDQIKLIAPEKMAIEEFQCLSELGKHSKDPKFKTSVTQFFWNIICNSDNYKEELVNNCITKFCEMVKYWDMPSKHDFFIGLAANLKSGKSSAIPSLKLFKGLIKDQKERMQYTYNAGGSSPVKSSEAQTTDEELTLNLSLNLLIKDHGLVKILLNNLAEYCELVKSKMSNEDVATSRKKLAIINSKYSHHDEIDERLQFLKYIAQISTEYQISKNELDIIYLHLVTNSRIPSDQEEFLLWCKASCEQSTTVCQILDLNEVGEFFSEKMNNGSLDVKHLLLVGFDFLQQYFISVNESQQKLLRSLPPKKPQQKQQLGYAGMYNMGYGFNMGMYGQKSTFANNNQAKQESKVASFKIQKHPRELDKLEIVWNIALHCETPSVIPKAIEFLIKVYYSLDGDIESQRIAIQEDLITRCMDILAQSNNDESIIIRVIEILKNVIIEAEKKGTGEVKPHSSLLRGELLDKIQIRNRASPNVQYLLMSIYSNTTFWDFKKQVADKVGLAPKYLKLQRANGKAIKDTENGRTLGELGFTTTEQLTAFKLNIEEEVTIVPLIGPNGKLTEKLAKIFDEWFDLYSNEDSMMTNETCALFIKGCTGEQPALNDERIANLFKTYDSNNDGFIERHEFFKFYETAARSKPDTVRENLKHHNIRADLKKLYELQEIETFQTQDMPRLKISKKQEYFDLLMSLLDKSAAISEAAWNLIQMLATSPEIYTRVLQVKSARDPQTGKIDWPKFFDTNSVYKLLYTLQITEAVMEEGEGEGLERVDVIDDTDIKKKAPLAPPLPGANIPLPPNVAQQPAAPKIAEETQIEDSKEDEKTVECHLTVKKQTLILDQTEDDKLKSDWTAMFLQGNGFQYILKVFMDKQQVTTSSKDHFQFELKHIAFLLKLLRIFIMAAFSTSQESQIYTATNLIRKSSSIQEQEEVQAQPTSEGSRFKQLQKLMAGPIGEDIISQIDYQQLMSKILSIIAQILGKPIMILEDKLIIENALSLLVGCVLHKNELLNDLYRFTSSTVKNCDQLILSGLLFCPQEKIREEFKQSLSCLSLKIIQQSEGVIEPPLFYLLKLLSENFSIISDYQCKQFFELFCELIDQYFIINKLGSSDSKQQLVFNPETLLSLIIDKIKDYNQLAQSKPSTASNHGSAEQLAPTKSNEDHESIYIGLIQLTGKIIDNFDIRMSERIVEQKKLIDEIFVHFLFASVFQQSQSQVVSDSSVVAKIKPKRLYGEVAQNTSQGVLGKKAKDAAYRLLNNLIKKSPLLMNAFLQKSMLPLMHLIKRHDGWNYSPPGSSLEGKQKYVGLKNLGCICYMNAMMQQFFMIPAFRYNLLSVNDGCPEDLQEYKGHKIDDNVLHQLQKLMAHLELSERTDYNPYEFCFAFKDFEGNPTNTGEQKDAQEFLNMSFDRIETLLKNTSRKYLMQSVFGGQTCSQVVCLECGTCKNRIEDFYNLSLTVKDIKSMADSLQKQIEGEVINEYECETCKKKVDISKRVLLSSSPNVLIVHLQRIIFNFDTFRNDKINSYFEFPNHLDLKPYSFYEVMRKEGRMKNKDNEDEEDEGEEKKEPAEGSEWPEEEDCWEYKLVGTTVHSGSANAGHYWSYINTRRGHAEPDPADPNWAKTEADPWMEFNDSSVRTFNFDKLKEECYGEDKANNAGGGGGDSWGFSSGAYGKSAYMLIYERQKKKPIKILVPQPQAEEAKQDVLYDAKKDEYYQLLDYKRGVEEIDPSQIYKQVSLDNHKFEFDNDIYSQEFFDFVKGILQSVQESLAASLTSQQDEILTSVKDLALQVAKKTIMDLLAKCYHNGSIKQLVEVLIDIMKQDESLCTTFVKMCFEEDNCQYLMEILLECPDVTARMFMGQLMRFIVVKLRKVQGHKLQEMQSITVEKGGEVTQVTEHASLCSRFIMKCLSLLNTQVAKNWSRFDHFLEIIYAFGCGEETPQVVTSPDHPAEGANKPPADTAGLEFLLSVGFVERVCDFMLGRKSPQCLPGEKRFEMGGSFNQPNFTSLIRLLTAILTNQQLLDRYPLSDNDKKMFLHADLLKVMLSSQQGGKQFGECLANMCRDNLKLSQKVSKVFIKSINSSSYDTVKSYLTALKPFLRLEDTLKGQRLEWVFGVSQVIARKGYREERYKYSFEFVERIADETHTYICPLSCSLSEEPLLAQLLKCKGKIDTFAINCLKELLSLMSKDEQIARYVYRAAPPMYQLARYSDWIRPYLHYQKQEVERTNSYSYFKNKHDAILKSLEYYERFEDRWVKQFEQEEKDEYEKAAQVEGFKEEVEKDWMAYTNDEVQAHYPPQLIIGKQCGDEREFLTYVEDPLVDVLIQEIPCEYNYSNPTGIFNLSIPHIEVKTNNYSTMSYAQMKEREYEIRKKEREDAKQEGGNETTNDDTPQKATQGDPQTQDNEDANKQANDSTPQEEEVQPTTDNQQTTQEASNDSTTVETMPPLNVRSWFDGKHTDASMLLRVNVQNKIAAKVKVSIRFTHAPDVQQPNVLLPESALTDVIYKNGSKVFINLQKICAWKPWTPIVVKVDSVNKDQIVIQPATEATVPLKSSQVTSVGGGEFRIQVSDSGNAGGYGGEDDEEEDDDSDEEPQGQPMIFGPGQSGICMMCMRVNVNNTGIHCTNCGHALHVSGDRNVWEYDMQ